MKVKVIRMNCHGISFAHVRHTPSAMQTLAALGYPNYLSHVHFDLITRC